MLSSRPTPSHCHRSTINIFFSILFCENIFRNFINALKLSPDVVKCFLHCGIYFQENWSKIYIYSNITDVCCFLLTLCKILPDCLLFQIDCKKYFFTFYIDLVLVCPCFPLIILLGHWVWLQAAPFPHLLIGNTAMKLKMHFLKWKIKKDSVRHRCSIAYSITGHLLVADIYVFEQLVVLKTDMTHWDSSVWQQVPQSMLSDNRNTD